jgi:hypothetical protein
MSEYYEPFSPNAPNMSKLPIPVITNNELLSATTPEILPNNVLKKMQPKKRKAETLDDIETKHIKKYSDRGKYNITITNKGYQCNVCEKIYQDLSYIMQHQKNHDSINSGVRNFVCEHCGRAYFYKKHLTQHIRLHHKK